MSGLLLLVLAWFDANDAAELNLGKTVRDQILREHKHVASPLTQAWLQARADAISPGYAIVLIDSPAVDPQPVVGRQIFVSAKTVLNATDARALQAKLAHAIGHQELRHGWTAPRGDQGPRIFLGGRTGVHPDGSASPSLAKSKQPQYEKEAEAFADERISNLPIPDANEFRAAQEALKLALR